jgi:hypothetical protein
MRHQHRTAIERWLEGGAPDTTSPELEAAWSSLFQDLPDESPSAAFADRVMVRVAGLRKSRDLSPRLRWALVAGVALLGVSWLVLSALLLAYPVPVGETIDLLTGAVKAGAVWASWSSAVWRVLAAVGQTTSVVLATPQAAGFLACIALLSAAALRLLFELLRQDRRMVDATTL